MRAVQGADEVKAEGVPAERLPQYEAAELTENPARDEQECLPERGGAPRCSCDGAGFPCPSHRSRRTCVKHSPHEPRSG